MKIKPLHDRVVVRRIEEEERTPGGVIIPDTAKEKPMQGEVLAVGPGARDESGKRIEPDVKAGDTVLFGKWSGTEVKIDGEELLIMKESDIMGIVESAGEEVQQGGVTRQRQAREQGGQNQHGGQGNPVSTPMPAARCCAASTCSRTRSR